MMKNIYGLIGEKLGHSFSPQIHGEILKKLGMEGEYKLFELREDVLESAVTEYKNRGIKGLNVTVPYKIKIMAYLDVISAEAEKIGAVNTISLIDGVIKGYNTDYNGFGMSLARNQVGVKDKSAVILGTGGVSKAVSQYFYDNGAKIIYIVSRNKQKAETAFKNNISNFKNNKLKFIEYEEFYSIEKKGIITNCTPCGMFPEVKCCPIKKEAFANFEAAVDLIYNPKETLFIKYANEYGI
jgi:shikimate dehydrogenase